LTQKYTRPHQTSAPSNRSKHIPPSPTTPHGKENTQRNNNSADTTGKSNKENVAHHWQQQHPNYHRTNQIIRPTKTNKPPSDQPTIMHGLLVWVYLLATTATTVGQTLQTHCPIPSQHNIAILMHKRFKVLHGRNELLGLLENRPSLWQNDIQALAHWKELTKEEKADHNKENDRVWWMEEFEERFVQYYGSKLCQGLFGVVAALEGKEEQPSRRTMSKEGEL
jgi:hypothetical protein